MTTVADIVFGALPRIPKGEASGTTFVQAINYVASMLARRIILRRSDLLATQEAIFTLVPGTPYVPSSGDTPAVPAVPSQTLYNLPVGFVSLAEAPFNPRAHPGYDYPDDCTPSYGDYSDYCRCGDRRMDLEPLTGPRSWFEHRRCWSPSHFNLLGQQIEFLPKLNWVDSSWVPPPAPAWWTGPWPAPIEIHARYYSLPLPVAAPADPIPFNGMFDQAFFQGVPRVVVKGLAVIQADPDFEAFIQAEVDTILIARTEPMPERRMKRSNYM